MSITSSFQWFGGRILDGVLGSIDARLNQAGEQWLTMSRSLAPVRTGRLRAEEDYQVANHTLILIMGASYDVFTEFGTRHMMPRPHVRPALNSISRLLLAGGDVQMDFNSISSGAWSGVHAHQGGFVVPSGIQPRPLTQAQHRHVQKHLVPVSKKLWHGNTKRAKMQVRGFGS